MAAVRSTPPRPVPMPTCGAVIQPIAVSVTSTASPLAAAASAAMPPVTTSGLAGCCRGLPPSPPSDAGGPLGSGASGTSAETLTHRSSQRSVSTHGRRAAVTSTERAGSECIWCRDDDTKCTHNLEAERGTLEQSADEGGGLAGGLADPDAGLLQGFLLGLRRARGTRDDRAGVPHRLALRGGEPGHVADDRLGLVLVDAGSGPLLGVAADLADHHDGVGLRVLLERLQAVDVRGPDHRVAADADRGGEADVAQLVHHLVGQRAGLGDQPDAPLAGDVGRDDAGVRLAGRGDARTVRPDDPGPVARGAGACPELGRVVHRDALGDHDAQRDLRLDRLDHRVLGAGRRHEHHRHVRAGRGHGVADRAEHRDVGAVQVDGLARLARVGAADDPGPRGQHARAVLAALGAGDALDHDPALAGQEDGHPYAPFASSAARRAAPSIVATCSTTGIDASCRMRLPSAALLPSSRTTIGRSTCSPRPSSMPMAETIPLATASQEVMPPKTFTNTLRTLGSDSTISRPLAMTSADAPPPMSRKLAGLMPPNDWPA